MVDIYQAASPAVGERLFDDDMLRDIYYICEEVFHKKNKGIPYPKKDVEEYFEEFHTIISFFKHIEITLDYVDLDWSALLDVLIQTFPQIAWIGGSKEKEENRVVYYIDFVPIAYREANVPFIVNLQESLAQHFLDTSTDVLVHFTEKIEQLVATFIEPIHDTQAQSVNKKLVEKNIQQNELDIQHIQQMEQAVIKEQYAKEKMRIANQKLEVVIEQMERQSLSRAIKELSKTREEESENWDQVIKVDLREYSQLLQKAKFLEQSWLMNRELMVKSEKMTVSENQLTYEREQVRRFKDSVSANEIYLILDECRLIESRVKVKKRPWFNQPHVRIMRMDYESLLNKAAYFDLIQGENSLVEQFVMSEAAIGNVPEGIV